MSDDIVDRLRLTVKCPEHGKHCGGDTCCCADSHDWPVMGGELFTGAADEIVRLRVRVAELEAKCARVQRIAHAAGVIDLLDGERALADQLADALRVCATDAERSTPAHADDIQWRMTVARPIVGRALAAHDLARRSK